MDCIRLHAAATNSITTVLILCDLHPSYSQLDQRLILQLTRSAIALQEVIANTLGLLRQALDSPRESLLQPALECG